MSLLAMYLESRLHLHLAWIDSASDGRGRTHGQQPQKGHVYLCPSWVVHSTPGFRRLLLLRQSVDGFGKSVKTKYGKYVICGCRILDGWIVNRGPRTSHWETETLTQKQHCECGWWRLGRALSALSIDCYNLYLSMDCGDPPPVEIINRLCYQRCAVQPGRKSWIVISAVHYSWGLYRASMSALHFLC